MPQASGWEEGNWGLDILCLRTVTGALCSADPQQDLVLENTPLCTTSGRLCLSSLPRDLSKPICPPPPPGTLPHLTCTFTSISRSQAAVGRTSHALSLSIMRTQEAEGNPRGEQTGVTASFSAQAILCRATEFNVPCSQPNGSN